MTRIRGGMAKLGRYVSFRMFTGVIGTLFLVSLGCDCFSLAPTFVNNKNVFGQPVPLSSLYTKKREASSAYSGVTASIKNGEDDDNSDDTAADTKSIMDFLSPDSSCNVSRMSGTDLAYIGDVVFELFIRSRHVWPSKRTSDLQNTVVGLVRGTSFTRWVDSGSLSLIRFVTKIKKSF